VKGHHHCNLYMYVINYITSATHFDPEDGDKTFLETLVCQNSLYHNLNEQPVTRRTEIRNQNIPNTKYQAVDSEVLHHSKAYRRRGVKSRK